VGDNGKDPPSKQHNSIKEADINFSFISKLAGCGFNADFQIVFQVLIGVESIIGKCPKNTDDIEKSPEKSYLSVEGSLSHKSTPIKSQA